MPSSFRAQSQSYLSYKSHNTVRGLAGIAPSGVWHLYLVYMGAYIRQTQNLLESGNLLEFGNVVMVDWSIDIQHIFASKCINLNLPTFCE